MQSMTSRARPFFTGRIRHLIPLAAALLLLCFTAPAFAKGRVVWKKTTIAENLKRESWQIEMEIHLPKPPDVAFVPMKFEFQPTAHFERSLVDGREEPQERTIPLTNQQALIESSDVGFLDAGTGVIQSRTRFSFKITRAHDFQAGEYKVTIKDTRDGSTVGVPTNLKLTGENPVVDRRSIVFTGTKKKEKKEEAKPAEESSEANAPEESEEEATPEEEPSEGNEPPSVDERPGGGCHHGPSHGAPLGWMLVLGLVGLGLVRRSRVA